MQRCSRSNGPVDRLETMRVFIAVAEDESFAQAARRLRMSAPAVTRAIAALEQRIGTRLLHRTTRQVRLTEPGRRFLADCRRILADLEDAESAAASAHGELHGQIGVTAPRMFGRRHVTPHLLDFVRQHPQLGLRVLLADRVVDLIEEDLDVAVRIAQLPDSSLRAIRVGTLRRVLCASPDYLRTHGTPRNIAELERLDAIVFSPSGIQSPWPLQLRGKRHAVSPRARMTVNSAEVAVAAALSGQGVISVLSYQAAPELAGGRLQLLLEEHELDPLPVHVVHPEGRRAAVKVRTLVEHLVTRLRADPILQP